MPQLKDTDFDDLFRRASEKYPLRTDSSEWDKMAVALEKDLSPTPDDSNESGDRRKRRILWLFLLLPLAGIGYITWHAAGRASGHPENAVVVAKSTATPSNPATPSHPTAGTTAATTPAASPAPATGGTVTTTASASTDKAATTSKAVTTGKPVTTGKAVTTDKAVTTGKATTTDKPTTTGNLATPTGNVATTTKAATDAKAPAPTTRAPGKYIARNDNPNRTADTRHSEGKRHGKDTHLAGDTRFADDNTTIDQATNPIAASFTLRQANIAVQRARIANPYALTVLVTAPETTKETARNTTKPKASTKQKTSYLYAGVIAAPDLSTVKMQHTTGVGNTFGILVGYAFNAHWAIETGAYVERKRYYTDGEYFDTKKVRLPPSVDLLNVDGTCYMWEIPINVRYNFNPGAKTQWFATGGLSTYLMNRENYTYKYSYWGTRTWDSTWNIKKNSQYPFSIIGLSAGFEQRLGKLGNLRVEPYVRIPLGGIGTGSLPIMSTGINIGFTRRLW